VSFGVLVGKQAVVGFRYPDHRMPVGKDENVLRDGEARVASHCIAVLGQPSSLQYAWTEKNSAQWVAALLGKSARVVSFEFDKFDKFDKFEKREDSMPKKGKTRAKGGRSKSAAREAKKGPPRQCGVCGEKGHTARSHEPGGRLA
jgi:hypothetical protein